MRKNRSMNYNDPYMFERPRFRFFDALFLH